MFTKQINYSCLALIALFLLHGCTAHHFKSVEKEIQIDLVRPFGVIRNNIISNEGLVYLTVQDLRSMDIAIFIFDSIGGVRKKEIHSPPLNEYLFFQDCFIDTNTILCFYEAEKQILSYDIKGTFKSKTTINIGIPTVSPLSCLNAFENIVYLFNSDTTLNVTDDHQRQDYYNRVNPLMRITWYTDVHKQKTVSRFGTFPILYKSTNNNYNDFFPTVCIHDTNRTILSFAADDSLYIYVNDTYICAKPCKSQYIETITSLNNYGNYNMSSFKQYMRDEPRYIDILYNRFNHHYYRVVQHKNMADKPNQIDPNRTWSIIVLDEELNLIQEVLFELKRYSPSIIIPNHSGVLISRTGDAANKGSKVVLGQFRL